MAKAKPKKVKKPKPPKKPKPAGGMKSSIAKYY